MSFRISVSLSMLFLMCSCATLNINEIRSLEKTEFEPLRLSPATDPFSLRIDLVRETHEKEVSDSTSETRDNPYHVMGFDLGNGIFFDLNENLCLVLNRMPEFPCGEEFSIKEIRGSEKNPDFVVRSFINDTLSRTFRRGKKSEYLGHCTAGNDTVTWWYKKRFRYSLFKTDSSLVFSGRKHPVDVIYRVNENEYYHNRKNRHETYIIDSNTVFLENNLMVTISGDMRTIKILRKGRRKNHLLYTLEKDDHSLYIYTRKFTGRKIVSENNMLTLYRDKYTLIKYELLK